MQSDYASPAERKMAIKRPRAWTSEETETLIRLWSERENLFNSKHPDYYKRDARTISMNDISLALGGVSLPDITRKMENLRSYFGREKRKLIESGETEGIESKSRWAYFKLLTFLDDHMSLMKRPALSDGTNDSQAVELQGGSDGAYPDSQPTEASDIKKPRINLRSSLNAPFERLKSSPTKMKDLTNLGPSRNQQSPSRNQQNTRENTNNLNPKQPNQADTVAGKTVNDLSDDMLFAEHIGRTMMTIKDDLLKEDLKLQIQQCLCATKRKQISQEQQRRMLQQNAPPYVSFTTIDTSSSPDSAVAVAVQHIINNEDTEQGDQ